jgi:tetratricopeptide (TPR) repeat protein
VGGRHVRPPTPPGSEPMRHHLLTLAAAAGAAFAATLGVLVLRGDSGSSRTPAAAAGLAGPPPLPPGAPTDQQIAALQGAVRANPRRSGGYVLLAGAYLQKVRETGDAGFYARAQEAVGRALALRRDDPAALTERGALALARHDFRSGLADATAAHRLAPTVVKPLGVMVDGLVELGRYGDAARTLQAMVDRRPDLAAYARVSYFRELHGDLDGAVGAMRAAASAGGEQPENVAYVQTLLGHLELLRGRPDAASRAYREARFAFPGYAPALAGLARVDETRGRLGRAIVRLRRVVERLPLPEYVVALGEAELAAGPTAAGQRDLELVRAEERLLAVNGVNTDVDLALFEADHGSVSRALVLARRAWASAPSVRSADALGWALARAGHAREGVRWARRTLALGSRDPLFLYHAGMAARAAGDRAAARRWLTAALARHPRFSPLYGPRAERALRGLR